MYLESLMSVFMVSGRCLEGVWKVSRRSLEGVWRLSGRLLEAFWINLEFFNLGFYQDQNENLYLELKCGPA